MGAYILYTSGLPGNKVAVHVVVQFEQYKWSESTICANDKCAKHEAHLLLCKWLKQTISKYAHQRAVALNFIGAPIDEVLDHQTKLECILNKHAPISVYGEVLKCADSIAYFLPSIKSTHSYWRAIIGLVQSVANEQLLIAKKQEARKEAA